MRTKKTVKAKKPAAKKPVKKKGFKLPPTGFTAKEEALLLEKVSSIFELNEIKQFRAQRHEFGLPRGPGFVEFRAVTLHDYPCISSKQVRALEDLFGGEVTAGVFLGDQLANQAALYVLVENIDFNTLSFKGK